MTNNGNIVREIRGGEMNVTTKVIGGTVTACIEYTDACGARQSELVLPGFEYRIETVQTPKI